MKDIKQEVDKFLQDFESAPEVEKLRNAISFTIEQEGLVDLKTIEEVEGLLSNWFERRLYSLGRIIKKFKTISAKQDYDTRLGIGYSIEAKKDKINIGRYLLHLLLIIESKDRLIKNLQEEVLAGKQTYLDMEEIIKILVNDETIPENIRNRFSAFYWLREYKEE